MYTVLIVLALSLSSAAPNSPCEFDKAKMLAMDEWDFDQGEFGWRELEKRGCYLQAAEIIADFRRSHPLKRETTSWMHEAQMRAFAGDYEGAVLNLPHAKHKVDGHGWNAYVDATIAFLRRDRPGLLEARNILARTPLPHTHHWLFDANGEPVDVPPPDPNEPWPPNLNVVDALLRCFDRAYREAYSNETCYGS